MISDWQVFRTILSSFYRGQILSAVHWRFLLKVISTDKICRTNHLLLLCASGLKYTWALFPLSGAESIQSNRKSAVYFRDVVEHRLYKVSFNAFGPYMLGLSGIFYLQVSFYTCNCIFLALFFIFSGLSKSSQKVYPNCDTKFCAKTWPLKYCK